jgi:hypothetical protein
MPDPRPGESRDDFLDRCIPQVIEEGREPDQAVAMCIAFYEGEKDKAFNVPKDNEVEYWKAFDRQRESFLPKYERRFAQAISKQLEPFKDAQSFADLRITIDIKPIDESYIDLYKEVGDKFARTTWQGLKKMPYYETKQEPSWIERMLYWARVGQRIELVNEETRRQIEAIIQKALEEGLSVQETVDLIVGTTDLPPLNGTLFTRARRIARTEIIAASNAGSLEGARSTGLQLKKQWLSTPDSRTRGTDPEDKWNHRQYVDTPFIVDVNEPFVMQGVEKGQPKIDRLQFPGDPQGSAGNVINCRCTQIYITPES